MKTYVPTVSQITRASIAAPALVHLQFASFAADGKKVTLPLADRQHPLR